MGSGYFSKSLCWVPLHPSHSSSQWFYHTSFVLVPCRYQAFLPPQGICTCCSPCPECFPSPLFTGVGTFLYLNSLSGPLIHLFIAFKSHNHFIVLLCLLMLQEVNLHKDRCSACVCSIISTSPRTVCAGTQNISKE